MLPFVARDKFADIEILELLASPTLGTGFVVFATAAGVFVGGGAEEGGKVLTDKGPDRGDGAADNAHVQFDDDPEEGV